MPSDDWKDWVDEAEGIFDKVRDAVPDDLVVQAIAQALSDAYQSGFKAASSTEHVVYEHKPKGLVGGQRIYFGSVSSDDAFISVLTRKDIEALKKGNA